MLFVGDLVTGTVFKNLPDAESYLVYIHDEELFATLPKRDALRKYSIGEPLVAAIKDMKGPRITLSQRTPHFVKNVFTLSLKEVFVERGWYPLRAVLVRETAKILVTSMNGKVDYKDLNEVVLRYLKSDQNVLSRYFSNVRVYAIPYRDNKEELVKEALRPAPAEEILMVNVIESLFEAEVYVPEPLVGGFLGKKAQNVESAEKLLGFNRITIKPMY